MEENFKGNTEENGSKFILFPEKYHPGIMKINQFNEDFEILKENSDMSTYCKDANLIYQLELVFVPKIKSLQSFFVFSNLRELNIISPLVVNNIEDAENEESLETTLSNLNSFQLTGLEHLADSLKILRLVNCGLKELDRNFLFLRNVEDLSLGENRIREIRNLHNCLNLKKLFLYSNKIVKIEYLQDCINIEELDLSDNLITKIENLDALNGLKKLCLAANNIDNLSNINNIKYLAALEEFYLNDENFWPNPVCEEFQNYFDIVLKLKPDLRILDSLELAANSESEVTKNIDNISTMNKYLKFNKIVTKLKSNSASIYHKNNRERFNIQNLEKILSRIYLEKINDIRENDNKEGTAKFISQTNLQNFLKLEMEYYFEFLESSNLKFEGRHTDILSNESKKINMVNSYLSLFSEFNKFLNLKSFQVLESECDSKYTELKILKFEFIYEFFKKFFPPYFLKNFNTVPMLVIRFVHRGNNYNASTEYESYMDFCNYEIIIIDQLEGNFEDVDKIGEFVKSLVNKDSYFYKLNNKLKFYKIKDKQELLDSLDSYAILFLDNNGVVKYLIFFYKVIESASVLFRKEEKSRLGLEDDLLKNIGNKDESSVEKFYSDWTKATIDDSISGMESDREHFTKKRLNSKELYREILKGEDLEGKILNKEENILKMTEENKKLMEDLMLMLN